MAEKDKKYYWLKLDRGFFKRHDIRIVEGMPNGKDYILFYMKLLCESVDHDGNLRFSDRIPYSDEMLSTITNTNIDIVRSAIKVFTQLEMMEIWDDGTLFMTEVQNMVGSETEWAVIKRKQRKAIELDNVQLLSAESPKCPSKSKSIEKEKELEIEKDTSSVNYISIIDLYHEKCPSLPTVRKVSDARKKQIRARLRKYSIDEITEAFERAEASDFLKGDNRSNWTADFDWIMNDANIAKILDGKYENKAKPVTANNGTITIPMPDYIRKQVEDMDKDQIMKEIEEMKGAMK